MIRVIYEYFLQFLTCSNDKCLVSPSSVYKKLNLPYHRPLDFYQGDMSLQACGMPGNEKDND